MFFKKGKFKSFFQIFMVGRQKLSTDEVIVKLGLVGGGGYLAS